MKLYKFLFYFLLLLAATSLLSCEDDDTAGPAPSRRHCSLQGEF